MDRDEERKIIQEISKKDPVLAIAMTLHMDNEIEQEKQEQEQKLKELTVDEFAEKLKADANAELYGNVDDVEDDTVDDDINKRALDDLAKFTKLIRKLKKYTAELKELEMFNKDNEELQKYIKLLSKVDDVTKEIDNAKKGYLYESAVLAPNIVLENNDVKVSVTLPYDKKDFDTKSFEEDYGPETEMYQKYMKTKTVKGNIKYKIKE